jgi:hypothetical protein
MLFTINKQKLYFFWPITLFKIILPFISMTFYGQIFLLFITVFNCTDGYAYVKTNIKCRTGLWFKILSPMAVIAIILHMSISIITILLYFNPMFSNVNSNILKKVNTLPDIIFLFTKIAFNITFVLDKNNEDDHWIIIFFLILFSGINAYFSICYQQRANSILIILNKSFSLILFLAVLSLLLGTLFKYTGLYGLVLWLILSNILMIFFIIFHKKNNINFALIDLKEIKNPSEYLKYIFKYYIIFLNKNNSRNDKTNFQSVIHMLEGDCLDIDCPLKQYLSNEKNGLDSQYLLIKYCDKLFQYGVTKFSKDINLKSNYISFLLFIINNRKKALVFKVKNM